MQSISQPGLRRPNRSRSLPVGLLILAALSVSTGCFGGVGTPAEQEAVSVHDSSGIRIVTNRGDGWPPEKAWILEPDLVAGEVEGPLAFGRVNWVAPDGEGGMLVLDGQSHQVHAFDSAGTRVRSFGREGDGPGEFRAPAAVTRVDDGRIAVAQGYPPVLHWLSETGDYLSSTRLPMGGEPAVSNMAAAVGAWQVSAGGRTFVQVQLFDPAMAGGGVPVVLMETDPAGESVPDTIARWTLDMDLTEPTVRFFNPVQTWMPRDDGTVILSAGSPYEVRWLDPAAGLARVMRRETEAVEVTERHRARAISMLREGMESLPGAEERLGALLEGAEFESTIPAVHRVWVSQTDGRLWLGVHDEDLFQAGASGPDWATAWDVFERNGAYLGRIPVPEGFILRVVTEEALYGVWKDDLDVPYAVKYRIVRPGG
jgi:hypothetical protein